MDRLKQSKVNARAWNQQHTLLRRLLEKDTDDPKARELFLHHHASVHTAKLCPGIRWSFADDVLSGLTDRQLREIPGNGEHSAVWALWHIARIEDVTMNILLADAPQVFRSGDWQSRLGSPYENVGNEMSPDEIGQLSASINLKALMAYRLAVGKRTRAIVRRLNFAGLQGRPAPARLKRIVAEGAVGQKAEWLLEYWGGKAGTNLLLMPATRHCFVHLNEVRRMRARLQRRG